MHWNDPWIMFKFVQYLIGIKDFDRAHTLCQKTTTLFNESVEGLQAKSEVLVQLAIIQEIAFRNLETAEKSYLNALQLWGGNAHANFFYGRFVHRVHSDIPKATKYIIRAFFINPALYVDEVIAFLFEVNLKKVALMLQNYYNPPYEFMSEISSMF